MNQYGSIDPLLSQWAVGHSLKWFAEYKEADVRVCVLGSEIRDRVEIWVDPPQNDRTVVHVFQSKRGLRPKKVEHMLSTVSELSETLDRALDLAELWLRKVAG
jgi:hypothetical protein